MTVGSILLGLALLVLVGLFVSRPLLASPPQRGRRVTLRQSLMVQKEAILTQIRALDFDFETGKIPEEDYEQQRAIYMAEAVEIVKQLDELEGAREAVAPGATIPVPAVSKRDSHADIDAQIEAAIARQREEAEQTALAAAQGVPAAAQGVPAAAQATPAAARPATNNSQASFCPQCGKAVDGSDKFCTHCGYQLQRPQLA